MTGIIAQFIKKIGIGITYPGRGLTINDKQQWLHTEGITQYGH